MCVFQLVICQHLKAVFVTLVSPGYIDLLWVIYGDHLNLLLLVSLKIQLASMELKDFHSDLFLADA